MGRKSLLKDVSRDEMLKMRESGMTNQDIAQALGVSYATIYAYLGAQPTRRMRSIGGYASPVPKPTKEAEPAPEACLVVSSRVTRLDGFEAHYTIDSERASVLIRSNANPEEAIEVSLENLTALIAELTAIGRNIEKIKVANEMW